MVLRRISMKRWKARGYDAEDVGGGRNDAVSIFSDEVAGVAELGIEV